MKKSINTLAVGLVMLTYGIGVATATENALPVAPVSALSSSLDREGNAGTQVTRTFDEAKQQHKVQNNSDRLVWIEASKPARGNRIFVAAGREAYPPMKSIVGEYRANYE